MSIAASLRVDLRAEVDHQHVVALRRALRLVHQRACDAVEPQDGQRGAVGVARVAVVALAQPLGQAERPQRLDDPLGDACGCP